MFGRTTQLLRQAGVDVRTFTSTDIPQFRLNPVRYVDNFIARRSLAGTLREFNPDVVHLHNFYHRLSPGILQELARYRQCRNTRVVMTAHDCHLICPNPGGTWFPRGRRMCRPVDAGRLRHWSYLLFRRWDRHGRLRSQLRLAQHLWNYWLRDRRRVIDAVICPSQCHRHLFEKVGLNALFLPPPMPSRRPQASGRTGPLHLIYAGRLEPEKGLAELLQILPRSFTGIFTIVGDGSDRERCERICQRRSFTCQVNFLGRRTHVETLELISRAHVLVVPSLAAESYSLCTAEALFLGTNVLVTDRGAPGEMVRATGMGFIFRVGNAYSLAEQLGRVVRSHRAGTLNRFNGASVLEARSEEAYLRGLLEIYGRGATSRVSTPEPIRKQVCTPGRIAS